MCVLSLYHSTSQSQNNRHVHVLRLHHRRYNIIQDHLTQTQLFVSNLLKFDQYWSIILRVNNVRVKRKSCKFVKFGNCSFAFFVKSRDMYSVSYLSTD